jgi:hypothetical protein
VPNWIEVEADGPYLVLRKTTSMFVGPCHAELNPGFISSGYEGAVWGAPGDGSEVRLPLSEFTKGDERFDYTRTKVRRIDLRCRLINPQHLRQWLTVENTWALP